MRRAEEMKTEVHVLILLLIFAFQSAPTLATEPWPAESNASAVKLTLIDTGLNTVNWSGAAWNPETRTLWLACNSGYFWALVEDGANSFRVATNAAGTKAKWSPGGDLESICQADYAQPIVYLMDEDNSIREFNVSQYGVVAQTRSWNISAQCPEVGGAGPEGLTFVPDDWLQRQGFRRANGSLYTSTNGMGGLMFVGHQSGGYVHVFDLNRVNNGYGYVGRFKTGRSETAGMEFDRTTGKLYVWHNTGNNYLEVTELGSTVEGADRRLRQLVEYAGPRAGNLEGFALIPTPETSNGCFLTDDDNAGGEAIMWYRQFQPTEDSDGDSLPDGWELWNFGTTTQTVGAVDSDLDGMTNAQEYIADTDPVNNASFFPALTIGHSPTGIVLGIDPTSTERLYHIDRKTNLLEEAWTPETNAPGNSGAWTHDVPVNDGTRMFYRSRVTLP
jgi:hypothetical protein